MKRPAQTLDEQAKAAIKAAKLFVQTSIKNLGHKMLEYRAIVGYQLPDGPVLVSVRKSSRDQKHLEGWVNEQKKLKLSYRLQTGFDRDTSSLDNEPRLEYTLEAEARSAKSTD